jgi:cysteine desulfurase
VTPRVYLDHHASAPLGAEARAAMTSLIAEDLGNPSSLHREGRRARDLLERARAQCAASVRAAPREMVFTSGGTEALQLAVLGVGAAYAARAVLCDPGAHPALRAACESLARGRGVALRWLPCAGGAVDYTNVIVPDGALVALSLVQHETGRRADGAEVLIARAAAQGARVVVDAVQALGKLDLDLPALGVSAAALSAHKLGGPQGVGALWLAAGTRIAQQLTGGGQERGVRAGTEALLSAVGFGAAAETVPARLAAQPAVAARRDRVERALLAIDGVVPSVTDGARVATVAHVAVEGCEGLALVAGFDLEGVALSSTSACSGGRSEPSESLLRLFPEAPWRASAALRVSLGPGTQDADIARFEQVCGAVIARVRAAHSKTKR